MLTLSKKSRSSLDGGFCVFPAGGFDPVAARRQTRVSTGWYLRQRASVCFLAMADVVRFLAIAVDVVIVEFESPAQNESGDGDFCAGQFFLIELAQAGQLEDEVMIERFGSRIRRFLSNDYFFHLVAVAMGEFFFRHHGAGNVSKRQGIAVNELLRVFNLDYLRDFREKDIFFSAHSNLLNYKVIVVG
jgi:hypothetical protein